jgi:alcohol dehydrogenase YqhD (iron-dependent ADH family)
MKDFSFYTPTRVVFGRASEEQVGSLVSWYGGHRVLVHYGGGSAVRSGLVGKMLDLLHAGGIATVELGGVVPNPLLSMVRRGIALCREQQVDFILAVGGGSVIDSAKAIAYGVPYDGDVWDFWAGKAVPQRALPVGCVLTIPAAGSEMSSSCVITHDELGLKRGVNSDLCRCRFAIMNPERTFTLPPYQTAAGAVDIMMHTMERYFCRYDDMALTDALAEGLLRTVKDSAVAVLRNPQDYVNRAQIMWAGSLAHNDLTECGYEKDFATHRLEHELSTLYGVTHGAGLAALWGSWARHVLPGHESRFAQFAVNVMGVTARYGDLPGTALRGIEAMEAFYRQLGMPTSIPELIGRPATPDEIALMVERCSRGGTMQLGSIERIDASAMATIYRAANQPRP